MILTVPTKSNLMVRLNLRPRTEIRVTLHADHLFRDIPLSGTDRRSANRHRHRHEGTRHAPFQLAEPPEWTRTEVLQFPGSVSGPWNRYVVDADSRDIGTVNYPRLVPKDEASAANLRNRTLTKLYNERPTWLVNVHNRIDEAVFAAYGWPPSLSDDALLAKLLELNLSRAGTDAPATPDTEDED